MLERKVTLDLRNINLSCIHKKAIHNTVNVTNIGASMLPCDRTPNLILKHSQIGNEIYLNK